MNSASTYLKKMKDRMKSPLALAAGYIPGCISDGPDRVTFSVDGKTVYLALDGNESLCFKVAITGKCITGKRALQYVCRQCNKPQAFKYILENNGVSLVSEYHLGEAAITEKCIHDAVEAIWSGLRAARGMPCAGAGELSCNTVECIHEVLEQLPCGFRRMGSGWMGSYDSPHFLHRIKAAASAVQGAQTLRFEICGDLLSGDKKRVSDALALFSLEANAQLRYVRVSVSKQETGVLMPHIETVLPVERLTVAAARAHIAALIAGADRVRAAAAGLASPGVAEAYLRFRSGVVRSGLETVQHE